MKYVFNELSKIVTKKSIVLIFLSIIILNIALVFNDMYGNKNNITNFTPKDYKAIYHDIENMTNKEAQTHLTDLSNNLTMQMLNDSDSTNDNFAKLQLVSKTLEEITDCINYKDYLKSVDDNAKNTLQMGLYENDSFSYRNIIKTKEDFLEVEPKELTFGPSQGITKSLNFILTDIIGLFFVLIITTSLLTKERELLQLQLLKSTFKGRAVLGMSKLIAIFITTIITALVLYGANLIIFGTSYGFGDLTRPIQSVSGFASCTFDLSVIQYIILFLTFKILVYLMFASLMYFVAVISKNAIQMYIVNFVVIGISAICYYSIKPLSSLVLFKDLNIISFLNCFDIVGKYQNINILGYPAELSSISLILVITMLILFSYCSVIKFSEQSEATAFGNSRLVLKLPIKTYKTTNLFLHECYKIFISGKVLIILIMFGLVTYLSYHPQTQTYKSIDYKYYNQYIKMLEGPVTQEKLEFIDSERDLFQNIFVQRDEDLAKAKTAEEVDKINRMYDNMLLPYEGFCLVERHTQYLIKVDGHYLVDDGYKLLTGDQTASNKDTTLALIAMFLTLCCITGIYSMEYQNRMNCLLKCSYKGRGKIFICKFSIALVIIAVILAITYTPYFYSVLLEYGMSSIHAPAISMQHLSNLPLNLSILEYLILITIMRYFAMIFAMLFVFFICTKLKSYFASICVSTAVIIIPLIIYLAGASVFKYVFFNPLILGNVF